MWMSIVWGLPYLVAVVAGGLICAVAGPRGPGTARWRVPAVVGFGLLVLQHLLQTAQTMMLYRGAGPSGWYGSPLYALIGVLGTILTITGLVLVAVAVVRGRGPVGIYTALQPPAPHQEPRDSR